MSESSRKGTILLVDDEPIMLDVLQKILRNEGLESIVAHHGEEAVEILGQRAIDVVVSDIQMPYLSGLELLTHIKREFPLIEVIMMTAHATVADAVRAVKLGAYDFLTKPFENIDHVAITVNKALEHRRLVDRNRYLESQLEVKEGFEDIIGKSQKMKAVFDLISSVSYSTSSVLIQGESGTGKELVARALHYRSPRKDKPFVVLNCSALTETLLESELFGHSKGSFTGAIADKKGLFEAAHSGSIFLDEIGDMPAPTQVKLLRVLQEGEIKRVGSNEVRRVDVRTIAATHVDLVQAKSIGRFREDLYYRLNVITIYLPSLRERRDDIPLLAYHFLKKYNKRMGKQVASFSPEALNALQRYSWPGNVRELENAIERAVVLQSGPTISLAELPPPLLGELPRPQAQGRSRSFDLPYKEAKAQVVSEFEEQYVRYLMEKSNQNVTQAARLAGLDRSNFRRIIRKLGE
ncbi:MAG: sigma-54-dependent Fis family transcriptional regulator [Myxococcales bacterium]|nr:sigma-54-dependent Fis family transcriptional regulator [Myxococcales bacterium]